MIAAICGAGFMSGLQGKAAAGGTEAMMTLMPCARANGFTFVDYHSAMAQPDGAMKPGLSSDGVHPTKAGYAMMRPLAEAAIARTLGESK